MKIVSVTILIFLLKLHFHLRGIGYVDNAEPIFSNWEMKKVKFLDKNWTFS